jgi:hypothetical protein
MKHQDAIVLADTIERTECRRLILSAPITDLAIISSDKLEHALILAKEREKQEQKIAEEKRKELEPIKRELRKLETTAYELQNTMANTPISEALNICITLYEPHIARTNSLSKKLSELDPSSGRTVLFDKPPQYNRLFWLESMQAKWKKRQVKK